MRSDARSLARPIRVTYLITDLKLGGVPLHLYRLATRLSGERVRVRVISLADEGPVGAKLRRAGIPVLACGARSARDASALARLHRVLRSDPPDILHSLLFHANMAARLVGPLAGIPSSRILCEIQTAERERLWHLTLDNLTCRMCRFEIGNSPSVVEHLQRHAHIPPSRLRCVLGAVDVESIRAAEPVPREALDVGAKDAVLLWTGRLDPVKGFEEMLAAFRIVRQQLPAVLLLAGEGPYRPQVEKLVCDLNLSKVVRLLGERRDIPSLIKSADAFIFCSRTEGLPNALLEAMAGALPIVATDVPGCRDLIRTEDTGLLVSPAPAEIAAGILRLLRSPQDARRMGERARNWVERSANIVDLAERWQTIYTNVLLQNA